MVVGEEKHYSPSAAVAVEGDFRDGDGGDGVPALASLVRVV